MAASNKQQSTPNNSPSMEKKFSLEGSLHKWTAVLNKWQNRWCVLKEDGHLYYYASKEKMKKAVHNGRIRLKRAILGPEEQDNISFTIVLDKTTFKFKASSEEEKDKWIKNLQEVIQKLSHRGDKGTTVVQIDSASEDEAGSGDESEAETVGSVTDLEEVDSSVDLLMMTQETTVIATAKKHTQSSLVTCCAMATSSSVVAVNQTDGGDVSRFKMSVAETSDNEDPEDVEVDQEVQDSSFADDDSLQSHRSVVLHILSQLRPGMDLSRVTLPTFILEKRSQLEMYADLIAHSDLFVAVTEAPTPEARMIAALKFFLTTFHAGRNSDTAKKPYNPVLGERFLCYMDPPQTSRRRPTDPVSHSVLESGPVPWAGYDSIQFSAEQVSHHPPISALYIECPSKGIYGFGSIQSKSRFLGLSVGIQNIGRLRIVLSQHNEEYIATLPSAYGRSILTVPWVELGGKCSIECRESGYSANIEFHCKPRFGGKRHRVSAEVKRLNEKKPVLKVEGEWNGVLYTKTPDNKMEVFADTTQMPIVKKKLKKIEAQESNESRRVWKDVTRHLKHNNEKESCDAKHEVEEKQRALARERKERGEEWHSQIFHLEGDEYVYNWPFNERLAEIKEKYKS